jgi:succinate dehydrogenase hydrophobic anchor subunit
MRYRFRPIDGALATMVVVIAFACIERLRAQRWSRAFLAAASLVMLTLLLWQSWLWVTNISSTLSEPAKTRRPLRLMVFLVVLFPLGLLLMTEVLDALARHTYLFQRASVDVAQSSVLCREVGCPINIGWPIKVSISETSESGTGTIEVPLSCPKGHATLYAEGTKQNGVWTLNREYFTAEGRGDVSLISSPPGQ